MTNDTTKLATNQQEESVNFDNSATTNAFKQDVEGVKGLINKLKKGIQEKREQAKQAKLQPSIPEGENKPKKGKPNMMLLVALGVFVFFVILLVAASLYKALSGRKTVGTVTASPTPHVEINIDSSIKNLSKYATDSGVVEIDRQVRELQTAIDGTNIGESQLTIPSLDFEVSF